ncbi:hypothetical protein [Glacieibacterium frigidum]|uniref:Uncharacterized protein n=1 Tax=Glacieibacterium frigidum TaxID=2593303 RepID=A0A552UHP0_9SPHN|nr:hypothetical protein [Glacieibacterium frigidum]TRW17742.1 hypothetical protein FMM06_06290 [Glacieibacterium frigidum]
MLEPSPRSSRLAIAASLAAVLALGGGGYLLGRATAPEPVPVAAPTEAPAPVAPLEVEVPVERTLRRADLIALGAAAADAFAGGTALPEDMRERAGQQFELSLPFGCDGPAAAGSDAPLRWRYDETAKVLRVHVAPATWTPPDGWQDPAEATEAMEGFWIAQPWTSRETCTPPGVAAPATPPDQTLGIVQLVFPDTPRQVRRDGKPYEAVLRVAPDAVDLSQGLRIRLTGRIGRFPDDAPVRCRQPGGRDQRPVCLIAMRIEQVAIENPVTGAVLSTWQPTGDTPSPAGPDTP